MAGCRGCGRSGFAHGHGRATAAALALIRLSALLTIRSAQEPFSLCCNAAEPD